MANWTIAAQAESNYSIESANDNQVTIIIESSNGIDESALLKLYRNVIVVDSVFGDNMTGDKAENRPFATVMAAINASESGDLIVVYPGTYTEQIVLKNGVDIYAHAGVTFQSIEGACIVDDAENVTCKILGSAKIDLAGTDNSRAIQIDGATSDVYIEFDTCNEGIICVSGNLKIKGNQINGNAYAALSDSYGNFIAGVTKIISADQSCITTSGGIMSVKAELIQTTESGAFPIYCDAGEDDELIIDASRVLCDGPLFRLDGGQTFIQCEHAGSTSDDEAYIENNSSLPRLYFDVKYLRANIKLSSEAQGYIHAGNWYLTQYINIFDCGEFIITANIFGESLSKAPIRLSSISANEVILKHCKVNSLSVTSISSEAGTVYIKSIFSEFNKPFAVSGGVNVTGTYSINEFFKAGYKSEIVSAADYALNDELTLKHGVISVFDVALVSTNDFSIVLPTPVLGTANECVFIFKVGASLPAINAPVGIVWRGKSPLPLTINSTYTIAFEQVSYNGTTFEIYGTAIKNV